jgi:uncharacterized delta-60 repeat protein
MRYLFMVVLIFSLAACDIKSDPQPSPEPTPIEPTPQPEPNPGEPNPEPTLGGTLDESFGNSGKVVFSDGDEFSPMAMAAQPDGRIVTLTTQVQQEAGEEKTFYLVRRFNTDGTLDPRFAQEGKFIALEADNALGPTFNEASAITVADSGRICFVGNSSRGSRSFGDRPVVGCLTSDGQASSFDDNGFAFPLSSQSGDPELELSDIKIDPTTGDVVIGGTIFTDDAQSRFWFFRMAADGADNDGAGRETVITFSEQRARLESFAFDTKGDIVAVGSVFDTNTGTDTAVALIPKTGARTTAILDLDPTGEDFASDVVIDKQNRPVLAVSLEFNEGANEKGALARLNEGTLELDETFGDAGVVRTFGPEEYFTSVALASDGKILAAGGVFNVIANGNDFLVARFLEDGSPDATFGSAATPGKVSFDVDQQFDEADEVVVDASGNIIVAGETGDAFALARLKP